MSQTSGFQATSTPQDITAGLVAGCYVAQVKDRVFYCTRETAPVRTRAAFGRRWFDAARGETFAFRVGTGIPPTWVTSAQSSDSVAVADIAIARTGA